MTKVKLLIGAPSRGYWTARFGHAVMGLAKTLCTVPLPGDNSPCDYDFVGMPGPWINLKHEMIADRALKGKYSHLLLLDDDMVFPSDTVHRLAAHQRLFVAASYVTKPDSPHQLSGLSQTPQRGYENVAYEASQIPDTGRMVVINRKSTGLAEVISCGLGVALINTEIFAQTPRPWFPMDWVPGRNTYWPHDVTFCKKARAAGFKLYVDKALSYQVSHVGDVPFGQDFASPEAKQAARRTYYKL